MPAPVVVIPCFNEERRLDSDALRALVEAGSMMLLLVDDGSSDGTLSVLRELEAGSSAIAVQVLDDNRGKAEAVRLGMLRAIAEGATVVGYYDADLSTPPDELHRLVESLESRPEIAVVIAARVALLGREIKRKPHRHYLGRVFATFASLSLALPVYDTQCGAKVFRVTPALEAALSRSFGSTWGFDVELLGRLLYPEGDVEPTPLDAVIEVPLRRWHDVAGSKLGPLAMLRAALDLARVARETRKRESWKRARSVVRR
jgi:dolichyl-phosphate beta-glucosyltransferase